MADDGIIHFPTRSGLRIIQGLRAARDGDVVSHPQANAYGHKPVEPLPRARFHPADEGAVRLGITRIGPDIVAELVRLFEREAWKTGDFSLFDDLCAARDGLSPEPPPEAA